MGSTTSKAARTTARKLPTTNASSRLRPHAPRPSAATTRDQPATSAAPPTPSSPFAPEDSLDRALDERLRRVGPVNPHPTFSPSSIAGNNSASSRDGRTVFVPSASTPSQSIFPHSQAKAAASAIPRPAAANPALTLLTARAQLARDAEDEFEEVARLGTGYNGRRFLDVGLVRRALALRDQGGLEDREIEKRLGLEEGVVGVLGRKGVISAIGLTTDE